MTDSQTSSSKLPLIAIAVLLLAGLVAGWFLIGGGGGMAEPESPDNAAATEALNLNRVALASMEDLDADAAEQAWASLSVSRPDDVSIALNRALNLVLKVDALTAKVTDASAAADEKQAAREQMPSLLDATRKAINNYGNLDGDQQIITWMNARVDLHEANLLPRSITTSIRKEVFQRLIDSIPETSDAIEGDGQALLGGTLTQVIDVLEDPINGVPDAILQPAASALVRVSDSQPSNLYLAVRAARLAITNESKDAAKLVRRTQTLAAAIEPTLRQQTAAIGKTPAELVDGIVAAIEADDFRQADNQMMLWFNLLNSTELIKTDRRRASPHPLDLISFESLRQLSSNVAAALKLASNSSGLAFSLVDVSSEEVSPRFRPTDIVGIDANLDFQSDVLTLGTTAVTDAETRGRITLLMQGDQNQWTRKQSLDIAGQWAGLMVADLFMVDSSSPGRLREDASAKQHNTLRSAIVYGESGAKMIVVDARPNETNSTDKAVLQVDESAEGLETLGHVHTITTGDFEGDGDLDLMAATDNGWELLVNRGNRTFFPLPTNGDQATSWDAGDEPVACAIADLDRDLDLDVVTVHPKSGRVGWIENLLHLQFRFSYRDDVPVLAGVDSLAIEDIDGNVSWDLVLGSPVGGQWVSSHTGDIGVWRVDSVSKFDWLGGIATEPAAERPGSLVVADLDNDSFFECLRGDRTETAIELPLAENGTGELPRQDVSWQRESGGDGLGHIHRAIDYDGDLKVDLLGWSDSNDDGPAAYTLAQNITDDVGKSLAVRFKGIDDNNANSGRVNHYAIGSVLELRVGPHYRSRIVTEPSTHFGLDGIDEPGNLRVIFPNGLTQVVPKVDAGVLIEEEQTLKGSCPYLYAFNGERFEFVTDCLWAAPLGLQTSPGVVVPDRPWEHLLIDGSFLAPRDGAYELRVTEELWEIAYFDQLALSAIDHPEDVVVFTNEKVGPASIATPMIHAFDASELTSIRKAVDTNGVDVADLLARTDGEHVQGFDVRYRQGLCPPHWIDLDLSDRVDDSTPVDAKIHLVLNGWILPTDTSLNIQIAQNPELPSPEPPSLWVPDAESESGWTLASPFIGFPGGKNKTIVVDVTEWVDRDDARVRIRTTNQIYWDSAAVSVRTDAEIKRLRDGVTVHPLELESAEVAWHGFSRRSKPGPRQAETYDYHQTQNEPRWPPLDGKLTRYGPAAEQLSHWDDSMVVISGGDEIRLRFTVPDTTDGDEPNGDPLRRDFVLYGVGWDKDADLNTLAGQSSMPLPFREMTAYPPVGDDLDEAIGVKAKNEPHLSREQPFRRFWSRGRLNVSAETN